MEVDSQGKQQQPHEQGGQKPEEAEDLANYKGIYYGDTNEKYTDPDTGAHFRFRDLCLRIVILQKNRMSLLNGTESLFPDEVNFSSEEFESQVAAESSSSSSGLSGNISDEDLDENVEREQKVFLTQNYDFTQQRSMVRQSLANQKFNKFNPGEKLDKTPKANIQAIRVSTEPIQQFKKPLLKPPAPLIPAQKVEQIVSNSLSNFQQNSKKPVTRNYRQTIKNANPSVPVSKVHLNLDETLPGLYTYSKNNTTNGFKNKFSESRKSLQNTFTAAQVKKQSIIVNQNKSMMTRHLRNKPNVNDSKLFVTQARTLSSEKKVIGKKTSVASISQVRNISRNSRQSAGVTRVLPGKKAATIDYRNTDINSTTKKKPMSSGGIPPLGAAKFHFSQSSMTKQRLFNFNEAPKPKYGNNHLKQNPQSAEKIIKKVAGSMLAPIIPQRPTRNQRLKGTTELTNKKSSNSRYSSQGAGSNKSKNIKSQGIQPKSDQKQQQPQKPNNFQIFRSYDAPSFKRIRNENPYQMNK